MAIPCKSVDEAVQALDGQFGYRKGYDRIQWSKPNDPATWDVDVEDALKDHKFDWGTYANSVTISRDDLTMESLQKAVADMQKSIADNAQTERECPSVKLATALKHRETLIPPGWTREMMEDIIYFQDESDKIIQLTDWPTEDQSTEESAPTGLESLADVLPDLYGRKEHAAYMARTARTEHAQNVGRKTAVQLRVRSLMDGLCGKHRGMED